MSWAVYCLETWVVMYNDHLDEKLGKDTLSSELKPLAQNRNEYCRASLVKIRLKSAGGGVCNPSQHPRSHSHDINAGNGFNPNTPSWHSRELRLSCPLFLLVAQMSQDARSQGKLQQYCTQQCLQGLIKVGRMD
ncbi:hypothetical protein BJX76DRAFT_332118 [Aspergillus varians]